jgi:hypothetical protein
MQDGFYRRSNCHHILANLTKRGLSVNYEAGAGIKDTEKYRKAFFLTVSGGK